MKANYSPEGKYLWDLWFIKEKDVYHAFYLQAKKTKDPEERHNANVSIGHAVSKDLINWKELPAALQPGKKGQWDDLALWTGSVIKKGKKYYLFYTGRNSQEEVVWIQRVGLAISEDLINWQKYDQNPLLEADKRYYQMENKRNKLGKVDAWRDPFVFKDPRSGKYCLTVSARRKGLEKEYNGCIAFALSDDLLNWEVKKPILAPGKYDEMETSQMVYHQGMYYLFFSVGSENLYEPKWKEEVGAHAGLHCYCSRNLLDGYKPVNENGVVIGSAKEVYNIRLLGDKRDEFLALGSLSFDKENKFVGKIGKPFKIIINGDKVIMNDS